MSLHWYALYTAPRCEKRVYAELQKRGIECFLPLQKRESQWSDRKKIIEEPLLKSYVFVRCDPKDFLNIQSVRGVITFLTDRRNCPQVLSEDFTKKPLIDIW
ncbi:MAG: transcription termination/antitermination NusG family protein [Odoribacter sp.]